MNKNKIETAPAYNIISVNPKNFIFIKKRTKAFSKKTITSEKAECAGFRETITQPQKNIIKNIQILIKNDKVNINL
jgi:hypothetical protein